MSLAHIGQTDLVIPEPYFNNEEMATLKNTIAMGASDEEVALFAKVCERTGLDPFAKQIYCVMRWNKKANRDVMVIQTAIDGYRLIAERSAHYQGQLGPFWCGADGEWRDVWLNAKPPSAARVGVLRNDFTEPLWAVAKFDSYKQTYKDGNLSGLWATMPEVMIAKCAESLALRRAFPNDLSGIYTNEEMGQADHLDAIDAELAAPDPVPSFIDPPDNPDAIHAGKGLGPWERGLHAAMGETFGKIPKGQMDSYRRRLVLEVSGELKSSRDLTEDELGEFHALLGRFRARELHMAPEGDDWAIAEGPAPSEWLADQREKLAEPVDVTAPSDADGWRALCKDAGLTQKAVLEHAWEVTGQKGSPGSLADLAKHDCAAAVAGWVSEQ